MGRVEYSISPDRIRSARRKWLAAGSALVALLGFLCLLVLIPAGVRALPGRYAARLPVFLQDLRHRSHPDTLPTPAIAATAFSLPSVTPTAPRLSGVTFDLGTPTQRAVVEILSHQNSPAPKATPLPAVTPIRATSVPTNQPTPQLTNAPTVTRLPTRTSAPTGTPTVTAAPLLPVSASLPPVTHTHQTWNNCGPATISMALYYFDPRVTQATAASFLKPDPEDKNVSPHEMAAYVRSLELQALVRVGGDLTRLKRLLAAGFPVVVETWFIPKPGDQMGHYRLLTGYDDETRWFMAHDSYNGPNVHLDYDAFDELWRVFNRVYVVVYHPAQADELAAILDQDVDEQAMYVGALETAYTEALYPNTTCVAYEDCTDATAFAWFNVGSSLTALGRHEEAAGAYDQARLLGLPWRMLWYQFGPYESYYAVDRLQDVITLATATLNVVDNLEESHYWRGLAYRAQENADRARADFEAAVRYNPNFVAAQEALESLE